jgi:predicted nuclease of predicted toxin-antitoxin system
VRDFGLKQADDREIWAWAKANDFGIVTTDADFGALARRFGSPPKLIHIEECDFPLRVIDDLLRRSAIRISEFQKIRTGDCSFLRFANTDVR